MPPVFLPRQEASIREQFYLDNLNLVKGEHLQEDDVGQALISTALARDNGLEIGDTFQSMVTENYRGTNEAALGNVYTYQVKGIFQVKEESEPDAERAEFDFPENYIFIDIQTDRKIVSDLRGGEFDWYRNGVNFYIRDPEKFEDSIDQVVKNYQLNTEGYEIERNNGKYENSAEPLERVALLSGIFTIVMAALGAVVLCLILLLWMRDRKHEMGIYLAAGIEKRDIYGQLAVESMLLYLAAFLMAVLFASVLNEALKSRLLIGEAQELVRETAEISTAGYTAAAGTAGIVITLAAVGISFLTVARMSPKEILSTN